MPLPISCSATATARGTGNGKSIGERAYRAIEELGHAHKVLVGFDEEVNPKPALTIPSPSAGAGSCRWTAFGSAGEKWGRCR
jgi:hypothetical protein